jgi:hypothetical protein
MKTNDEKRVFYDTVSSILNIEHSFHNPVPKKTRWNARFLGNGRFPGFGLVQCFGHAIRVVSKKGTKVFYSYEEVYDYLKKVVDTNEKVV